MARDPEERKGIAKENSPAVEMMGSSRNPAGGGRLGGRLRLPWRATLRQTSGQGEGLRRSSLARRSSWCGRFAPGVLLTGESARLAAPAVATLYRGRGAAQAETGGVREARGLDLYKAQARRRGVARMPRGGVGHGHGPAWPMGLGGPGGWAMGRVGPTGSA
jgi:hypothetical protein